MAKATTPRKKAMTAEAVIMEDTINEETILEEELQGGEETSTEEVTSEETQKTPAEKTVVVDTTKKSKAKKEEEPAVQADLTPPVPVAKAQINSRVATNRDHSCVVGGVRYTFYKGKQQSVPVSVKDILMKAGLLMPL